MKFKTLTGNNVELKNSRKYRIDWAKESRSQFQTSVKRFLYPFWKHDIVFEELRMVGTRMTFDFFNANKNVAIEVQGGQHIKYVKFFHKNKNKYIDQLKRDDKKMRFCEINDLKLVEIYPNDEVSKDFFLKFDVHL